ncbi:sialidase family protein [Paenibacillus humicola]|uniref:sialidase family protein n=1 Tax=Paenibacillus humicola TaxID=3110540 RepID=UPI00237B33DD|nr:sialidase family protein [Paenibacillus humicola]
METKKEFVFADEKPFKQCHASTVLALSDGEVLTAYFAGTREKNPDVAIWLSRRSREGSWSAPAVAADEADIAHWNPVLFQAPDTGHIWLFYKVGHEIPEWFTRYIVSKDGGHTWSEPAELVPGDIGGRGPVRNKPIVLRSGRWLAPASLETKTDWDAFVDISDDGGRTWRERAVPLDRGQLKGKGIIQPTLWEDAAGVHMLLRSTEGFVYRSGSADNGESWTEAHAIDLPNNNSGIDLAAAGDGRLYLVMNPVRGDWAARTPLVLQQSEDGGRTWREVLVLEDEPGEYSYPAIIADGGTLHLTYTWRRERIVYWRIDLGR